MQYLRSGGPIGSRTRARVPREQPVPRYSNMSRTMHADRYYDAIVDCDTSMVGGRFAGVMLRRVGLDLQGQLSERDHVLNSGKW